MLHNHYANLTTIFEKRKFREEIAKKCRVCHSTVLTWICEPSSVSHRTPRPIYRKQIAKIAKVPENELFPNINY